MPDEGLAGFWLRGVAIGLAIAAPVGPIGVLCIRRTLAQGRAVGLLSGLGAASADAVYGCIAAFGLTALSGPLMAQRQALSLGGGLFLVYLGLRTLRAVPGEAGGSSAPTGLAAAYLSTFVLTLANPMTIISFAAVFAGLGLAAGGGGPAAAVLVAGVFAGSALWWLALSTGVSLAGRGLDAHGLTWVNRVSGGVLLLFGLAAVAGALAFF